MSTLISDKDYILKEIEIMGISITDFINYSKRIREKRRVILSSFNKDDTDIKLRCVDSSNVDEYMKVILSDWYNQYGDTDLRNTDYKTKNYVKYINECNIETSGIRYWIVENDIPVGGVCINCVMFSNDINISFFLYEEYRGQGIMTYTLNKLINTIIDENIAKENEIVLKVQRNNVKSWNIMKRLGFNLVDVEKGKHCNNLVYRVK